MNKDLLIKQLLYRSAYRGCKETDILLGKFIVGKISEFGDEKLQLYQKFIQEDDALIYDWILNKSDAPDSYLALIQEIRIFHDI